MNATLRIRSLTIHAQYGCRHTGACCTAGWRIPAEPVTERAVVSLMASGALMHANEPLFERAGSLTVTALAADGACVFFERGVSGAPHLCAIHRIAGFDAKPVACRQFPRVSLQDARGISVSLSHFCPTAAELLFATDSPLAIVDSPAAFPGGETYEGLNALDALPPLLAPEMLMDVESYDAWERHMVAVFAHSSSAVSAIDQLAADVEGLRAWRPVQGHLVDAIARLADAACRPAHGTRPTAHGKDGGIQHIYERLDRSVVALATPTDLRDHDEASASLRLTDLAGWDEWEPVVCRYLAARAFASWMAYQGRGLRTVVASLYVALDLVRGEVASLMASTGRRLDRAMLKDAIRQADLRFVHHADSQRLADTLGMVEH